MLLHINNLRRTPYSIDYIDFRMPAEAQAHETTVEKKIMPMFRFLFIFCF